MLGKIGLGIAETLSAQGGHEADKNTVLLFSSSVRVFVVCSE